MLGERAVRVVALGAVLARSSLVVSALSDKDLTAAILPLGALVAVVAVVHLNLEQMRSASPPQVMVALACPSTSLAPQSSTLGAAADRIQQFLAGQAALEVVVLAVVVHSRLDNLG
jgi:hypothetical protein